MRVVRTLRLASLISLVSLGSLACDPGQPEATGKAAPGKAVKPTPAVADQIREAKGVDLSKLSDSQRDAFFDMINTESSACGKPHSLATSLRDDPECRDSVVVAEALALWIGQGLTEASIEPQLDEVMAALKPAEIDVEGRMTLGNPKAPVTVVVFADFQCPKCKAEAPLLREEVEGRRGQAKLVFKHFPLSMHPRAEFGAIAVEAAHLQGKGWEMHDLVFANQTQLEDADLERYAGQIAELDLAKWKADYAAETTKAAVVADRAEGKTLALSGTPTVFVNGRRVTPLLWDGELSAWIDDALRR